MSTPTLDIKLQGRTYSVACPPEEREALLEAANLLDARLAEIAQKTRSTGERLAVMAALNLAHELTAARRAQAPAAVAEKTAESSFDSSELKRRIRAMEARLDKAMSEQEALF